MSVFVLNADKTPLMPCLEKRARQLLDSNQATIVRYKPFIIRLNSQIDVTAVPPLRLKLDPGAKVTGVAVLDGEKVVFLGELVHKVGIKKKIDTRRAVRRFRRSRHSRYRQSRFNNRGTKQNGWLPPSLEARINQVMISVKKLLRYLPISSISLELVKFDTQKMVNPEISGVEYQQGTLWGYEVREYLLAKWGRKCAYCGKTQVPLQIEHLVPKSRGGSNRVSNLALACNTCNKKKGTMTAAEFGHPELTALAKQPLTDAAMMTASRWALYGRLVETGLPVEVGTGGRTKWNRSRAGYPKTHYFDAAFVGESAPERLVGIPKYFHVWTAKGRGNRRRRDIDKFGFPRRRQDGSYVAAKAPHKRYNGFAAGDYVKKNGELVQLLRAREGANSTLIQRFDGWNYDIKKIDLSTT